MVDREIPVARITKAIPPRPSACASAAAQHRRERSVKTGASARYLVRSVPTFTDSQYSRRRESTSVINQLFLYKP
jgi:hypothetical protein